MMAGQRTPSSLTSHTVNGVAVVLRAIPPLPRPKTDPPRHAIRTCQLHLFLKWLKNDWSVKMLAVAHFVSKLLHSQLIAWLIQLAKHLAAAEPLVELWAEQLAEHLVDSLVIFLLQMSAAALAAGVWRMLLQWYDLVLISYTVECKWIWRASPLQLPISDV
jgi:hypothetical protein